MTGRWPEDDQKFQAKHFHNVVSLWQEKINHLHKDSFPVTKIKEVLQYLFFFKFVAVSTLYVPHKVWL